VELGTAPARADVGGGGWRCGQLWRGDRRGGSPPTGFGVPCAWGCPGRGGAPALQEAGPPADWALGWPVVFGLGLALALPRRFVFGRVGWQHAPGCAAAPPADCHGPCGASQWRG